MSEIASFDIVTRNPCCGSPYPIAVHEDGSTSCGGCERQLSEPTEPEYDEAEALLDDAADAYFERCHD